MNNVSNNPSKSTDIAQLDALTGGAFMAPTSGERTARVRDWLASEPSHDLMAEVFRVLSHRDKGAAKPVKEKLDEIKRVKAQESIMEEWAAKARALLEADRINLADTMAWLRDAAKAGAPLSREPLAGLKQVLAERMKGVEDLQHRVQVERESAVLLAQRIELLSTKPWAEAQSLLDSLRADVMQWQAQADTLSRDAAWGSLDPKFPVQLEASRSQLTVVWEAFEAALAQAVAAASDPQAPLPAVPVWADELRLQRGETLPQRGAEDVAAHAGKIAEAGKVVGAALVALEKEIAQGHGKTTPKAAAGLRNVLKEHGRYLAAELEVKAQALLAQADELDGWQRWRADQLREELVAKAVALTETPDGQKLGGRKMQETLRGLREQWKTIDQGGAPNHALWRRFDDACNLAHKVVEVWLTKLKEQNEAGRAQRLALLGEVQAWTAAHVDDTDWRGQSRALHDFAERWRQSGHLSEKLFAELQPQWKTVMHEAHARLEAAQAGSIQRRYAMIEEAKVLGEAPTLRIDAVKALQQRWQQEAHAVALDRKQEQKLWEAFRKPLDEAFERKGAERQKSVVAMSETDQRVVQAAQALEAACASQDAQQIRNAVEVLQAAQRGVEAGGAPAETARDASGPATEHEQARPGMRSDQPRVAASTERKLVAVRGDDRPGMPKTEPAQARSGKPQHRGAEAERRPERKPALDRSGAARPPRLGDAAFRAQRDALSHAEQALRKLAAQAHGEVLTQLTGAWERRDAAGMPAAQLLGRQVSAAQRAAWIAALEKPPVASVSEEATAQTLLRLEIAAEVPSPVEQMGARRMLQLQLLTSRHAPAPVQTWAEDVARLFAHAYDAVSARRLQNSLKVLLRKG